MKVVYMGTPEFAVAPLEAVYSAGHEIKGVFTQPDRAKGRGKKISFSPVKDAALRLGMEACIYQPERLREEEYVNIIKAINPDIIIVAAYGQILSEDILNIPRYGCINIHASLLPKYRGASPVEASILSGDEKTGITIMYMAKGLDTGDIICKDEIAINPDDTTGTLTEKLSRLGAKLVTEVMKLLEAGTATRTPQNDAESSYSGKIAENSALLQFKASDAESLNRLIRAYNPVRSAYTYIGDRKINILETEIIGEDNLETAGEADSGDVIEVTRKYFTIKCSKGALRIRKVQPEGKKPMNASDFLNGHKLKVGDQVGDFD